MCSRYERVFPDVPRIRPIADAYRDVCPHRSGRWRNLPAGTGTDGITRHGHGIFCHNLPSSANANGDACYTCFGAGVLYVYTFDYAAAIVGFIDVSLEMRSQT